jgi:hypothetical protein
MQRVYLLQMTEDYLCNCGLFCYSLWLLSPNTWYKLSTLPITHIWWLWKSHIKCDVSAIWYVSVLDTALVLGQLVATLPSARCILILPCGQEMARSVEGHVAIKPRRHSGNNQLAPLVLIEAAEGHFITLVCWRHTTRFKRCMGFQILQHGNSYTEHKYNWGDQNKEFGMRRACSAHGEV